MKNKKTEPFDFGDTIGYFETNPKIGALINHCYCPHSKLQQLVFTINLMFYFDEFSNYWFYSFKCEPFWIGVSILLVLWMVYEWLRMKLVLFHITTFLHTKGPLLFVSHSYVSNIIFHLCWPCWVFSHLNVLNLERRTLNNEKNFAFINEI